MVKLTSFERERVQVVAVKVYKFLQKVNDTCQKGLKRLFSQK